MAKTKTLTRPIVPRKRPKTCGHCGGKGHNITGCPKRDKQQVRFARRAHIRAILDRTAAARRELDERAAGADLRGLANYPAVFAPYGIPKPPGIHRLTTMALERDDDDAEPEPPPARPPIPPPVPFDQRTIPREAAGPRGSYRCSVCKMTGHTKRNCPHLVARIQPAEPRAVKQIKNQRCAECGRKGHNARTCPEIRTATVARPDAAIGGGP